jgi:phosphatidylserine/phosphatidylglycerophosphate/cardiolipin synthase-like enzyme
VGKGRIAGEERNLASGDPERVTLGGSARESAPSPTNFLANQGVPTKIDAAHAISHNKVMIVDTEIVITGSFNFTKAAQEKSAENPADHPG